MAGFLSSCSKDTSAALTAPAKKIINKRVNPIMIIFLIKSPPSIFFLENRVFNRVLDVRDVFYEIITKHVLP